MAAAECVVDCVNAASCSEVQEAVDEGAGPLAWCLENCYGDYDYDYDY